MLRARALRIYMIPNEGAAGRAGGMAADWLIDILLEYGDPSPGSLCFLIHRLAEKV